MESCAQDLKPILKETLEAIDPKNLQDETFQKFTQLVTISHSMFPDVNLDT